MPDRRQFLLSSTASGLALVLPSLKANAVEIASQRLGLSSAFTEYFKIGVALSSDTITRQDKAVLTLVEREFNSLTAENCQKWEVLHPSHNEWNWTLSDQFVDYAQGQKMHSVGHTLVWHSQVPDWVFQNADGSVIAKADLLQRMQEHINTLVGRYKGRIQTWDVVNEAVSDEGYNKWRESHWYNILGPDFMERAFAAAHKVDADAELLYNDYNMHIPAKRDFLVPIFKDYIARKVPLHGVGFQAHYSLDSSEPTIQDIGDSLEAYSQLGLNIHITELDIDVLPSGFGYMGADITTNFEYSEELNPYPDGLPEVVQEVLAERYEALFRLFIDYKKSIKRVTFWGADDGHTWKNNWPVKGRTNYPLLFDRRLQPKKAYDRLLKLA